MPVDLDYIKPFMGFCTALTWIQMVWLHVVCSWFQAYILDSEAKGCETCMAAGRVRRAQVQTKALSLSLSPVRVRDYGPVKDTG